MKKIKKIKALLLIRLLLSFVVGGIGLFTPKYGIIGVLSLGGELFEDAQSIAYGLGALIGLIILIITFIRQIIALLKVLKLDKMEQQNAVKTAQRINKYGGAAWAYIAISMNGVFALEMAKLDFFCLVLFIITWIMRRMVRKTLDNMLVELIGATQAQNNQTQEVEETNHESKPRSNASKFD